jgi:hypothetical protein
MRQCGNRIVDHDSGAVENLLEFGGGFGALVRG